MLENQIKLIREGKMSIKFPKDYGLDMVEKVLLHIWPEDTEWLKNPAPMSMGIEGVYGVTDGIWATTNGSGKFIRSYPLQMLYMEIMNNDTVLNSSMDY